MKTTEKKMRIVKFVFCNALLAITLLVIPILEILYGTHHEQVKCENSVVFNVAFWLIIKGILNCASIMTIILMVYYNVKNCLIYNYFLIMNILTITWLLGGSIIFVRDCSNIKPNDYNVFIWISIINGYIGMFNYCYISLTYEMYTYDSREPLLMI